METKQWMLAQWGSGWRFLAVATATWKTSHVPDDHAQLSHNELKSISIGSSVQIGSLRLWMVATLEYHKVCTKWVPGMLTQELLNQHEAEGGSFLDRIITGDETWCHHYEKESKRQSMEWRHVNTPSKKKFKTLPSAGKVMCTVFWDRKGVILLDFLESRQTINSDRYIAMLSWRLKFPESGQRRKEPFSCNMITPGPIPVWRRWSTSISAGLSYNTHRIVRIWLLLTSICSGQWKIDCVGDIFLATTPSCELWNSGPPPLVQIFMSPACRLFIVFEIA